jgi:hypothetical protein
VESAASRAHIIASLTIIDTIFHPLLNYLQSDGLSLVL